MRTFTRDTDDMNEVLADFIGHPVLVKLRDGSSTYGVLAGNPDVWSDGYMIGPFSIEKDEVISLIDLGDNP